MPHATNLHVLLVLCAVSYHAVAESAVPLWMDPNMPVAERVEALLANMSITDKLWQLQRPDFNTNLYTTGCAVLEYPSIYANAANATVVAQRRNAIQKGFLSSGPGARLGIPVSFRLFSIHGAEAFGTTFAEGPGMGATFDPGLGESIAQVITSEARALGADMSLFVINLWADARFGRQEEGFSEEPTLTAAFAGAVVLGSHGSLGVPPDAYLDNTTGQIAAFFKHVGAYGAAAGGLNGGRADVPEHTVREVYLKPWRRGAVSGSRGAMPSHQTILNVPSHASTWLLRDRLRGDFNQSKAVFISDTGDVQALGAYRLCNSDASCAALAINAGVDIEQVPGTTFMSLPTAIAMNLTSQSTVDNAVRRVLNHKFSLRLFDQPYVDESLAATVVNSPDHRALAQQVAEEGAVLLINRNNALPLPASGAQSIAVIGPNGGCGFSGSGAGNLPPSQGGALPYVLCEAQSDMLGNYAEGMPPPTGVATVAESIAAVAPSATVAYSRGCNINDNNLTMIPAAVTLASASDVIVAVLGDSTSSCGESMDRDDLDLPGGQMQLLKALAGLGKPLIVVLINGRTATFGAYEGNAVLANVSALLVGWRPGQMGGPAIANLLFGLRNPSGRLPNSWVRSVGQVGSGASPWLQERVSLFGGPATGAEHRQYGNYVQSVNNPPTPLFSFGFGLSYTSFTLSSFSVNYDINNSSYPVSASVTVTNTGSAAGATVVQLYVQDPVGVSLIVRPWKRLAAFQKVKNIVPGAGNAVSVTIPIRADDLGFYGDDMVLRVQPGEYTLSAGQSSTDDDAAGMQQSFTIPPQGSFVVPLAP